MDRHRNRRNTTLCVAGLLVGTTGTALAGPTPLTLAAIGDSTGTGAGTAQGGYVTRLFTRLSAERPGSRLFNLSRNGATSATALEEQLARVPARADLVTIGIGGNDVVSSVSEATFAARFEALVAGVRARTKAPIVVSNIPDVSMAPVIPSYARPAVAARVASLNRAIAASAAKHQALVFDLAALSRTVLRAHPEYIGPDGFHPSDEGHEFWANELWKLVAPLLGTRSPATARSPG
jgi:lysophospholipase L1-like esterase